MLGLCSTWQAPKQWPSNLKPWPRAHLGTPIGNFCIGHGSLFCGQHCMAVSMSAVKVSRDAPSRASTDMPWVSATVRLQVLLR